MKSLIYQLSLLCLSIAFLPQPTSAEEVLFGNIPENCCDGRFVSGAASIRPSSSDDRMAQPFMTQTSGAVSIRVPLAMLGSPVGNAHFEIWNDANDAPNQRVAEVGTVDLATLAPTPNGEIVTFDSVSGLEPNTLHYLMLILSDATLPNNNNTLRLLVTNSDEGVQEVGNLLVLINGSWRPLKGLLGPVTSYLQMEVKKVAAPEPPSDPFIITTEDGSVTKVPDLDVYPIGSEVTVTAAPEEGFEFTKWTYGDQVFTDNPTTIIVQEGLTLTPMLVPIEEPKPLNIDIAQAVAISWDSQSDTTYQIHSSVDMETWDLAIDHIAGTGERMMQCFLREDTEEFYRVEEMPQP